MAIQVEAWVRSIVVAGLVAQSAVAGATLICGAGSCSDTQIFTSDPADLQFKVVNGGTLQPGEPATVTPALPIQSSDPDTLTFSLFNPALGTLNSVTISFATTSLTATATLQGATNNSSDPSSVTFFADGALTVELTSGKFPGDQVLTPDPTVSDSCAASGSPDNGTSSGGTCNGLSHMFTGSFHSPAGGVSGLSTASFIGPGFFDVTATLSSALSPRVDPDNGSGYADNATFMGFLTSLWSGSVTVQYDYTASTTAIPEPLTLYLLLAGLGGMALSRRLHR